MKKIKKILKFLPGVTTFHNVFIGLVETAVLRALRKKSKNITLELQTRALKDTVDYIEEYMPNVKSYGNKLELLDACLELVKIKGLFLEFGVWTGGTINHIASRVEIIYGFDSFEGLPEDWREGFPKGYFRTSKLPDVKRNVALIKGWFNETLHVFLAEHEEPIAFIHIDCDLYSSTKTIFNVLGDRIKKGCILVFDEYFNYPGWRLGEYKAFQEFCQEKRLKFRFIGYCNNDEQVAVQIDEIA